MKNFELEKWEVENSSAQNGAIDAAHVLPFRGRSAVEFELRRLQSGLGENLVFFREAGYPKSWNFVLAHEESFDKDLAGTPINWRETLDLSGPKFFTNCLQWNSFGRVFHFEAGELPVKGRFRATLGASGEGVWLDLDAQPHAQLAPFVPFRWHGQPCAAKLWDWEIEDLKAHFLALARDFSGENPAHDVGFALDWATKSARERQKPIGIAESGTMAQARELLRAALRMESALWKTVPQATWAIHSSRGAGQTFLKYGATNHEFQISPRLASLRATIFAFFGPHDDPNQLRHACVARDASSALFEITTDAPTMHETLDAGWELRQWLAGKVAKSYVDEVVPVM